MTPLLVTLLALLVVFVWLREKTKRPSNLPPGPKPLPIIGNVFDLNPKELWLIATRWAQQYGGVTSVNVFGITLIFLNTPEAASDLLDKKGSIYSDKPSLVMCGELCGCENMVAFTPYGDQSKRQRRIINSAFGPQQIPTYHPLILSQTHVFLRRLITSPADFVPLTRTYAGSLTLSVVYGYTPVSPTNDPFLNLAEECVDLLSNRIASGGGIWLVDVFPSLKNLPEWAPGSGFLRNAREWKAKMEEFVEKPYEYLRNSMKSGKYVPSFCSTILEEHDMNPTKEDAKLFEFDVKWTANSMYSASMDTTITTVAHFLLAMMKYPDALRKAQAEIDQVVGTDRLPVFEDRPNLPYIDAMLNEIWRWSVPVPLNLPHRLMEDDIYDGMFIPKGSLVFGNIWAIARDPAVFPNPDEFLPERYLDPKLDEATRKRMDPREYVFGFGRRVCPGSHLVESSVWILLVSMMAALQIGKPKDEYGREIEPDVRFENSVFRTPTPFQCDIRPRSEQHFKLIRESELLADLA